MIHTTQQANAPAKRSPATDASRRKRFGAVARLIAACALVAVLGGADWRQFRGNLGDGTTNETAPKSLDKIAWTAPLPGRGISGPVVVGGRVYVTASSGYEQDRLHVLALRASNGELLWDREFWATGRTQCHPSISVASCTPASDGRRIVALFSTNDLACLDTDGNLLWFRGLTYEHPKATNSLGMASSPVLVADTVIAQLETDDESFAIGINVETGQTRWKLDRPRRANWTSPLTLSGNGGNGDLVVLQSSNGLEAIRPKTGETVWAYADGASTAVSSTVGDRTIYVPSHGLTAVPISGQKQMPMAWRRTEISPSYSSPVFFGGRTYAVVGSILIVTDAKSGEVLWRLRLKGTFYSSPIAAAGRLYLFNHDGLGQIVSLAGQKGRIVGEREFGETIFCTPAVSDGALYVRSDHHLWKIAD